MKTFLISILSLSAWSAHVLASSFSPHETPREVDFNTLQTVNEKQPNLFIPVLYEGTRGGGDSELWGAATYSAALFLQRTDLLERFSDVDWANISDATLRDHVESQLVKNPLDQIKSIQLRIQEKCFYTVKKHAPALLADNMSTLCVESTLGTEQLGEIWDRVLIRFLGTDEIFHYFKSQSSIYFNLKPYFTRKNNSKNFEARRLWNTSQPVQRLNLNLNCESFLEDDTAHEKSTSNTLAPRVIETRKNGKGLFILKLTDGYAVCN